MESELNRNMLTNLAGITGTGYASAYDRAMQQFNTEQDREAAAQTAANTYGLAGLTKQAELGGIERGIEQAGIEADRMQFEEERDFPFKQVQYMQSLLQGLPVAAQSYSYMQPSQLSSRCYLVRAASKELFDLFTGGGPVAILQPRNISAAPCSVRINYRGTPMAIDQEIQSKVDAYRSNPQQLMQRYQQNQQLVDLLALQKLKSEKEAAARDMQLQMQQQPQTIKQQREAELLNMTKQEMMQQTQGVMQQRQAQQQKNMQQVAQQGLGALANQRPAAPQGAPQGATHAAYGDWRHRVVSARRVCKWSYLRRMVADVTQLSAVVRVCRNRFLAGRTTSTAFGVGLWAKRPSDG
jgi:hypothetical protein